MFGGPPMMPAQQFAPQYAMPGQQYNVPAAMASAAPARPAPPSQPMTTTPPRPVVRAQAPDTPAPPVSRPPAPTAPPASERPAPAPLPAPEQPALVNLPAPEQLGVTTAGTMDWTATHARLEKLGVTCFHEERLANGTCRVVCVLPAGSGGQTHRVEAEASSAAEAVQVALNEAETWKARR
jgi:hypothetical protein